MFFYPPSPPLVRCTAQSLPCARAGAPALQFRPNEAISDSGQTNFDSRRTKPFFEIGKNEAIHGRGMSGLAAGSHFM